MANEYLIWSHEHSAWWGPGGNAYVRELSKAGRYSRESALRICVAALPGSSAVPNEVPVRLADLLEMCQRYLDEYKHETPTLSR